MMLKQIAKVKNVAEIKCLLLFLLHSTKVTCDVCLLSKGYAKNKVKHLVAHDFFISSNKIVILNVFKINLKIFICS